MDSTFARIDREFFLHYFDDGSPAFTAPISVELITPGGVSVGTETLSATGVSSNVYVSANGFEVETPGAYVAVVKDSLNTTLTSKILVVGRDNRADYENLVPITLSESLFYLGGNEFATVTARVVGSDGIEVTTSPISFTYSLSKVSFTASSTITIDESGDYFIIWYVDGSEHTVDRIHVGQDGGIESVDVWVGYVSEDTSVPQASTTVTISEADGTVVDTGVTDATGYVQFSLGTGSYIATLSRAGDVFTANNFTITVSNTSTTTLSNRFQLIAESHTVTISSTPSPLSVCSISGTLYDLGGLPRPNVEIYITNLGVSGYTSTTLFSEEYKIVRTDANGYFTFDMVQGSLIEVAIMSTSLRRRFTVPAAATADLLTLMSGADDVFSFSTPDMDDAIVRSI